MTGKLKLYIGLLALGLVAIGGGLWLLATYPSEIKIPEGNPVIYEKLEYLMRGQFDYFYIYQDGSMLYVEEKGLRIPTPGNPPTRTWSMGKLTPQQLDSFLAYLEHSGLDKLEEYYSFPGEPIEGGGFRSSDLGFTITINSEKLNKSVKAFGYFTLDNGETYPDMPAPLNDIYGRLRVLALATEEVYQENIRD